MKRCFLYLFLFGMLASCHDELTLPQENLKEVLVVYMMAENSLSTAAQSDLSEIRSAVKQIPDDCAVVVFFDNSRTDIKPQIISFDSQNGEKTMMTYGADPVSTDSTVMLSALKYIVAQKPADRYRLVLWSHGSGWLPAKRTIGIDNGRNTTSDTGQQMEISTLRGVLEQVGVTWDYILFDACFMQCVEVAYELRHLTSWCIASPAEIPYEGAPYDQLMPAFFISEGYAESIPEQYHAHYAQEGVLLSAVRTDKLEALADATAQARTQETNIPSTDIQAYCTYSASTGWKSEYYDMGSWMTQQTDSESYLLWKKALDDAVPYRYVSHSWTTSYSSVFDARLTDAEHYSGLSMYVPVAGRTALNAAWRRYQWYERVGYLWDQ